MIDVFCHVNLFSPVKKSNPIKNLSREYHLADLYHHDESKPGKSTRIPIRPLF